MLLTSHFAHSLFSSSIHRFLSSTSLILAKHSPPDGNDDDCAACGGSGFLICCDSCSRSFHFTCCDPPLDKDEDPDVFNCHVCLARMAPLDQPPPPPKSGEKEPGVPKKPIPSAGVFHPAVIDKSWPIKSIEPRLRDSGVRARSASRRTPAATGTTMVVHNGGGQTYDTTT
jgi:PHD-finger